MSERYHDGSRELQDRFDTRRLADRLEERVVREVIRLEDREFIERMDMLFLATADAAGQPDWKRSDLATGALPAGDPAAEPPAT